jgi:hypothetical protein
VSVPRPEPGDGQEAKAVAAFWEAADEWDCTDIPVQAPLLNNGEIGDHTAWYPPNLCISSIACRRRSPKTLSITGRSTTGRVT